MPGGGLEPNEDSSAAAIREVMEEAGVIGRLARCLGSFEVCFNSGSQEGSMYISHRVSEHPLIST